MIRKPNPTKPTPMMVADELTPSDMVTTSGTLPTTARLPPTPMNINGAVSRLLTTRSVADVETRPLRAGDLEASGSGLTAADAAIDGLCCCPAIDGSEWLQRLESEGGVR